MKFRNHIVITAAMAALSCNVASAAPPKTSGSVPFARTCQVGLTVDYYNDCDALELLANEKVVIENIAALCWHEVDDSSHEFTKFISAHLQFKGTGDLYYHSIPVPLQKSESGPSTWGSEGRVYYNGVISGPFYAEAGGNNKIQFSAARTSTALSSGYAQCNFSIQGQYQ